MPAFRGSCWLHCDGLAPNAISLASGLDLDTNMTLPHCCVPFRPCPCAPIQPCFWRQLELMNRSKSRPCTESHDGSLWLAGMKGQGGHPADMAGSPHAYAAYPLLGLTSPFASFAPPSSSLP